MTLGERIAYYRGKLGLSQGELAEQLGVSRQAVSKWETDAGLPDLERLIALSRLYHITLDELVKGESPEETAEAPEEIPVDAVIAKPAAPSGQKTIGYILLGVGLLCAVLALFLSYTMLNVCDLSTDGCFTLGAAVGATVAIAGHPYLAILAAMAAGVLSGFITALLQTKMGIDSLLAGIIVNTGLYSINIAVMGGSSLLNMNKTETVFTKARALLQGTVLSEQYKLLVAVIAVIAVVAFLALFLRTRLGLAIRATGDNPDMVRSSSINPTFTTIVGLCVANAFTGLSGCLLAQSQKSVSIDIGTGMVTIALASLLMGQVLARAASSSGPSAWWWAPLPSAWCIPSPCGWICPPSC